MDLKIFSNSDGLKITTLSKVSGLAQLSQAVILELLNDPNPILQKGSGGKALFSIPGSESSRAEAFIQQAISATEDRLKGRDLSDITTERLRSITLVSMTYVNGWRISLYVVSESGKATTTEVVG